jgi:hypothetical protein
MDVALRVLAAPFEENTLCRKSLANRDGASALATQRFALYIQSASESSPAKFF